MGIYFGGEDRKVINLEAHSGKNGISAYEVAVKNGFVGTEEDWLLSLKGEKGDKGDTGKVTKSAVVIACSASGASADMCDFLYNEGDDFSVTLADATAYAQSLGIGRIEMMAGVYKVKRYAQVFVSELIGVGNVTIERSDGNSGFLLYVKGDVVTLENIKLSQSDEKYTSLNVGNTTRVYFRKIVADGNVIVSGAKAYVEECVFGGNLKLTNTADSHIVNCDINALTIRLESGGTIVTSSRITTLDNESDGIILRDNEIGGEVQRLSAEENFMGVKFGRILPDDAAESITLPLTSGSFEIFINEKSNMTVNIYTGNSTPAKSLTSDTFIFLTGNDGDDVQDGAGIRKTLILYLKTTLGVPTLSKWIAYSGSDTNENVKVEIICPASTYHGIMENETGTIYCDS